MSCAFAGPLLPLLNSSGAGFHLRGVTSCGKSTALKAAGSVLGGGDGEKGFLRSWNSTLNGRESVAKLHNHALLLLDEIGEANPKTAGAAAYSLVNGQGRERMKSDLTRREASRWTLILLSSGEKSLADMATEAGQKIKGGQEIRLLDIPADAGTGFGIFEDLHGMTAKGLAVAMRLRNRNRIIAGPWSAVRLRFQRRRTPVSLPQRTPQPRPDGLQSYTQSSSNGVQLTILPRTRH
jgi:uncharacterized protein (DUF927 family)